MGLGCLCHLPKVMQEQAGCLGPPSSDGALVRELSMTTTPRGGTHSHHSGVSTRFGWLLLLVIAPVQTAQQEWRDLKLLPIS